MTADELMKLMEKFKDLGLASFEVDGIKMTASIDNKPAKIKIAETQELEAKDIVSPISVFDELDEEDILYWSTPYWDVLQEKKEAMRKAKENEI